MNKPLTLTLAIATAFTTLGIGGAVMAQEGPQRGAEMTRADAEARATARFARMDANHDGVIDAADREARARARFDRADANGDGMLSFAEMQTMREDRQEMREERRAERGAERGGEGRRGHRMGRHGGGMRDAMMQRADADNDGTISQAEFTSAALTRFDRADANNDGTVTAEERRTQRQEHRGHRRANRG